MKIGIITVCGYDLNYGSILQMYSLYKFLEENNYEPYIFEPKDYYLNILKNKNIFFYDFVKNLNYCNDWNFIDKFIIGSDQVLSFGNEWFDKDKFYNLKINKDKKIMYSAGCGKDIFKNGIDSVVFKYLKNVKCISLRDFDCYKSLKKLNIFDNISLNIDPVFLHDFNWWSKIFRKPKNYLKYICCSYYPRKKDISNIYQNKDIGPMEFLYLIYNNNIKESDSFHFESFHYLFHNNFLNIKKLNFKTINLNKILSLKSLNEFRNDSLNYISRFL